jgi:RNA polymerase II subunit A-like phosphatase
MLNSFCSSDIGLWAISFGARVSPDLTEQTTHVVADPARRTSKVRQAAMHPNIFIVDKSWLAECFSKWHRVPEKPYIISVEPDARPVDPLPNIGPTEMDIDTENAADTNNVAMAVDVPEVSSDEDEEEAGENFVEEFLPAEEGPNLDNIDFDDLMEEFENESFSEIESLDDDEGDDAENEDDKDGASSTKSNSSEKSGSSKKGRKRKRKHSDTASASSADSSGTDASGAEQAAWKAESDLQRRKKRAFERTSSLTKVQNAADVDAPRSVPTSAPKNVEEDQNEEEEESDEDAVDEVMKQTVESALASDLDDERSSETAQNDTPAEDV